MTDTETRQTVSVRFHPSELACYQALADQQSEGNLSQQIRKLAAEGYRAGGHQDSVAASR